MIEILLGTLLGVMLGTISGIIPGVHANTLAGVLLSLQVTLLSFFSPLALAGAMFAALITHTLLTPFPAHSLAYRMLILHLLCFRRMLSVLREMVKKL